MGQCPRPIAIENSRIEARGIDAIGLKTVVPPGVYQQRGWIALVHPGVVARCRYIPFAIENSRIEARGKSVTCRQSKTGPEGTAGLGSRQGLENL